MKKPRELIFIQKHGIKIYGISHLAVEQALLKIDLHRFLPLSSIKYLPVFAGNIEKYFSCAGMMYLSCRFKYQLDNITNEYTLIYESIKMHTNKEVADATTA